MKILLIGFEPTNKISYPHTEAVLNFFNIDSVSYFYFKERGYFLDDPKNLISLIRFMFRLLLILVDTLRLIIKLKFNNYKLVIAIDNFAYVVASHLFSNVVLWSHDFVSNDQDHSDSITQKLIARKVKASLQRNGNLIIQDEIRMTLFLESVKITDSDSINVFYLPVSLEPVSVKIRNVLDRPIVLQIGGINVHRSGSDRILNHYQNYSDLYDLAFHGYLDKRIISCIQLAEKRPWVSNLLTKPSDIYKVVEKCDIGFLYYVDCNKNFFNISKASGQFVEFIRCGKPVIVFGKSSLSSYVETKGVGIAVQDESMLENAIKNIAINYTHFSNNAIELYENEYNIHQYLYKLQNWLEQR